MPADGSDASRLTHRGAGEELNRYAKRWPINAVGDRHAPFAFTIGRCSEQNENVIEKIVLGTCFFIICDVGNHDLCW
jgi:hypothetical protein